MAESINNWNIPAATAELTGEQFNFQLLEIEFCKLCPSYADGNHHEYGSEAVHFSTELLYKIAPAACLLKRSGDDQNWQLLFLGDDNRLRGTVVVRTCNNWPAMSHQPVFQHEQLLLTVEQATLLAIKTYCCLVLPSYMQNKVVLMPPLVCEFFDKDDMEKIASEIHGREPTAEEVSKVIVTIIQSCYSGGQYLEMSSSAIACIVAVITALEQNLSDDIILQTYRQYSYQNKEFSWDDYVRFSRYVIGGIPTDINPQWLLRAEEEEILRKARMS